MCGPLPTQDELIEWFDVHGTALRPGVPLDSKKRRFAQAEAQRALQELQEASGEPCEQLRARRQRVVMTKAELVLVGLGEEASRPRDEFSPTIVEALICLWRTCVAEFKETRDSLPLAGRDGSDGKVGCAWLRLRSYLKWPGRGRRQPTPRRLPLL